MQSGTITTTKSKNITALQQLCWTASHGAHLGVKNVFCELIRKFQNFTAAAELKKKLGEVIKRDLSCLRTSVSLVLETLQSGIRLWEMAFFNFCGVIPKNVKIRLPGSTRRQEQLSAKPHVLWAADEQQDTRNWRKVWASKQKHSFILFFIRFALSQRKGHSDYRFSVKVRAGNSRSNPAPIEYHKKMFIFQFYISIKSFRNNNPNQSLGQKYHISEIALNREGFQHDTSYKPKIA